MNHQPGFVWASTEKAETLQGAVQVVSAEARVLRSLWLYSRGAANPETEALFIFWGLNY